MAYNNFVVKNGLTVNGSFTANSTVVNAAALTATSVTTTTNNATIGTAAYFAANGNLGIGIATPGGRLGVVGPANTVPISVGASISSLTWSEFVTAGVASNYMWNNGGNFYFGTNSDNFLSIGTNGVDRMRVTSTGSVGIGSLANDYSRNWRLAVREDKNASTFIGVINANTGASAIASIVKVGGTGNSYLDWNLEDNAGNPIDSFSYGSAVTASRFIFDGNERVRITSSGNVGIGTSSPSQKFDVNGTSRFRQELQFNPSGTIQSRIGIGSYTGSEAIFGIGNDNGATANNIVFYNAGTERVRVDASGNVGIGTSTPAAKLSIAVPAAGFTGDIAQFTSPYGTISTSLTSANGDNRIIINTLGPSSQARYPGFIVNHYTSNSTGGDSGGFPVVELLRAGGNNTVSFPTPADQIIGGFNTWGSNSTSVVSATRIEGVSEAAFTTAATAGIRFLTTNAGTQTEVVRFAANGNVGIGTGSPTAKLTVTGTANVSGNVVIGGTATVTGNVTLGSSAFFVGNGVSITTLNATNITTGTLPDARLSSAVVNTSGNFTISGTHTHAGDITLNNTKSLNFKTLSGAGVSLTQQSDDNFVFYTTNSTGGARSVYSIFANSDTSAFRFVVPVEINTQSLSANGTTGSYGQLLTSNGSATFWSSTANNSTNLNGQAASYYLNATNLASGTVPTARLATTGTASSSTYLRGDQTWATITSNPGTVTSVANGAGLLGPTITSSGSLSLPTVGPGAATYSGGISSITLDNYGRVSALGSSAGYYASGASPSFGVITANGGYVYLAEATGGLNTRAVHNNSGTIGFLNSSNAWVFRVDDSGNATAAGNVTAYSDIKLKTNIHTITDALNKVKKLRGVSYQRISDNSNNIGVIAQEVQEVIPEVIQKDSSDTMSVAYGNLVGVLIEAIKELSAEVDALKNSTCKCTSETQQ